MPRGTRIPVLAAVQARSNLEFHMGQINPPSFLSEKETAAYITISLSTIRRLRRAQTGPAYIRFGGVLRYPREALDAFLTKNTKAAA